MAHLNIKHVYKNHNTFNNEVIAGKRLTVGGLCFNGDI